MAKQYGLYVDTLLRAAPPKQAPAARAGGHISQLRLDTAELVAAAAADIVSLGFYKWETLLSPDSKVYYDALGTGVTLKIGDATDDDKLAVAAAASSAGSRSLIASIAIENYGKPLWDMLGYASLAAAKAVNSAGCELLLTVAAVSTTADGTVTWDIKGIEK